MQQQVTNEERQKQHKSEIKEEANVHILVNEGKGDEFSDSLKGRKKYKDVADAAQAAFESAAYAAAAARAAVELSRFQSHDPDNDDDHNSSSPQPRKVFEEHDSVKAMSPLEGEEFSRNVEELEKAKDIFSSDSAADEIADSSDAEIEVDSVAIEGESGVVVLESKMQSAPFIDLEKKPFSVRTRRVHGY